MSAAEFLRCALVVTRSVRRAYRLTVGFYGFPADYSACGREIERWRSGVTQ